MQKWKHLQQGNHHLGNPFFCPEYTTAIANAGDDVFVGLLEQDGQVVGFFPFQQIKRGVGAPVGWPICDYQGVVAAPETVWDVDELLRSCGLKVWHFDHLILPQSSFQNYHHLKKKSLIVNLANGSDNYFREKQHSGSEFIPQIARKTRKLEREIGPVRFEPQLPDHAALDQLFQWWTRKWSAVDPRHQKALHAILEAKTDNFAGMLSALYAGDELAALVFGIRSRHVWHYWFPSFNPEFAQYSPGAALLTKIIAAAPSLGITVVDLGAGEQRYKQHFTNGAVTIAQGLAEIHSLGASARRFRRKLEKEVRQRPQLFAAVKSATSVFRSIRRPS